MIVILYVLHKSDTPQNRRHQRSKRLEKHSDVKRESKEEVGENYIRRSILIFTRIHIGLSRVIESRRVSWEGHTTYVGNLKNV